MQSEIFSYSVNKCPHIYHQLWTKCGDNQGLFYEITYTFEVKYEPLCINFGQNVVTIK